ncbi:MAG: hypothetical protein KC619_33945 [Myxococcales bacterium]|nr:hypothetical protein [Myxococcales bacterium]
MRRITLLACILFLTGCPEPVEAPDASVVTATAPEPSPRQAPTAPTSPSVTPARATVHHEEARVAPPRPTAGAVVRIPAGTLRTGSQPGWPNRSPATEADLAPVEIPAFDIDALPYPNDPDRPVELAATRVEATRMCEARGRRLCHELEWERACRGDGVDPFATGETIDVAACAADPLACPSSLGVFDLGVRAPEWTSTDADERLAYLERTAVVRGGRPDFSEASHRCGSRLATNPAGGGRALGFRCCGGDAPELSYPDVGERRLFRDLELDQDRWRQILASVPETQRFAAAFVPFGEPAATRALARGGASAESVPWEVAAGPFAWSPAPGEEVWVVAGASGETSLLVALYPNHDGTSFHHAASFVFAEPETPIALMRTRGERAELQWTTCWSCGGENGAITFGEDARIVITQR